MFFVKGGTGCSLLYLAKDTEYSKNLPMIHQMVNSFHVSNGGSSSESTAAASGGVSGGSSSSSSSSSSGIHTTGSQSSP